jgi:hypothetical protein
VPVTHAEGDFMEATVGWASLHGDLLNPAFAAYATAHAH